MNLPILSVCGGLLLLPFAFSTPTEPEGPPAPAKYVGAKSCKNCHSDEKSGDPYAMWASTPHAKAFETLASKEAKEIAAKLKIDDPQKSDQCLQCHVTAHGIDKKLKKRSLKASEGVGCESCHGPGEPHSKARMKAAMSGKDVPVAADEITVARDVATCTQCHNEKSPTYKPFCFKERMKAIAHWDPRKGRTKEQIAEIEAKCVEGCEVCAKKEGDDKK